ncbi:hypothetical protein Taro_046979, partial [Colocasia esculenta]|nr:hypothetical protein [Colocasia esculenta]
MVSTHPLMVSTLCHFSRSFFMKTGFSVSTQPLVSVDTRPSSQETQFPDWDRVSTQSLVVSTLDPASRRPFLDNWDSVSTHSVVYIALVIDGVDTSIDGVDTGVDTVPGSVDTRPSFQKTLFGQLGQCVDTLSGSVDTLRLKFQLMIFSRHVAAWGSREST